jgi:CRISPR-associated endonuclease/helicase Cas3
LSTRLREPGVEEALAQARHAVPEIEPARLPALAPHVTKDPLATELFLRFLFSALVDADFLDTEGHARRDSAVTRGATLSMGELWERFAASHTQLIERRLQREGEHSDIVDRARTRIYEDCLAAADASSGMFRLSAPTGGGKTRAAMAFALRHALRHGQQRIIVAVPFITITEQTAQVYRDIFGTDDQGRPAVLEHHSGAYRADVANDDFDPAVNWSRLAAENWDAPIIVTTTVQLFESLFSAMTSRSRKVHRLTNSVIILDEAQALPPHLLTPILDALQQLCTHYRTSVVISTATQPAFEVIPAFRGLDAREIVQSPGELFSALRRVTYDWRTERPLDWPEVAALLSEQPKALAIVNTKRDARALLDALDDPGALHLSTSLCGAHRRAVINTVRERLRTSERCRLISTQVVEAGVDLDFPLVLRAIGPLDGIIQAAGRCNREGSLDHGRVIVFEPAEGGEPQGAYKVGIGITRKLSGEGPLDPDDPAVARRYFQLLYETLDADREHIQELRQKLKYPDVARAFRMIDDDSDTVVVEYGVEQEQGRVRAAVDQLRSGTPNARLLMREIQPYTVAMRKRELEHLARQGLVSRVIDGVWQWHGRYDEVQGVTGEDLPIDRLVF